MAGGISFGQALGLLGGVPVLPAGGKTIIEGLRAAKSVIPGDMGGILSKVLSQGPGAILQNPIGAVLGGLQGQLGGLASQLSGITGAEGLLSSLTGAGGLSSALSSLGGVSNLLSGLGVPGAGQFGVLDAISHMNVAGMLGSALPAGLGLNTIMGPILMGGQLSTMAGMVPNLINGVVAGTMDPSVAALQVAGMTNQITGVLNASTTAFNTMRSAAMPIAQTAGIISSIVSNGEVFGGIANMIIQDQHKAEIQAAMDKQVSMDIETEAEDQT